MAAQPTTDAPEQQFMWGTRERMRIRLEDKIAFITGTGSGLSREATELFAEESATIVAADIDLEGPKGRSTGSRARGRKALRSSWTFGTPTRSTRPSTRRSRSSASISW